MQVGLKRLELIDVPNVRLLLKRTLDAIICTVLIASTDGVGAVAYQLIIGCINFQKILSVASSHLSTGNSLL